MKISKRAWKNIGFWVFVLTILCARVYDIAMRMFSKIITFTILVVLFAAVLTFSAVDKVALAEESSPDTYLFSADEGEFVVTHGDDQIYRGGYDEALIIDKITSRSGENFTVELELPTVSVSMTSQGAKHPYSKEDLFSFSAVTIHGFDSMNIINYSKSDLVSGYKWFFSRENGAETKFGGQGANMNFGSDNAYGKYKIFAYGQISLTFGGKTYTSHSKSAGVEIEIEKTAANPVINETALTATHSYGKSVAEILKDENVQSRNFAFVLPEGVDGTVVYGIGTYGIEIEYVQGSWNGATFVEDESVDGVKLSLNLTVEPYLVQVLIHHVKVKQGDEVRLTYQLLNPTTLPNGEKGSDLQINLYAESDGSVPGQYLIQGEWNNPNYKVVFSNYENKDNRDYSTWATLTVKPIYLTVEYGGLRYTLYRFEGFDFDDSMVLVDCDAIDGNEGSKTIKVYRNYESVTYTDMTLIIEALDDSVDYVKIFKDGQWQDTPFGEGGKITLNYSTEMADTFKVLSVAKTPRIEEPEDATVAWALLAIFAGLFLCIAVPNARRSRYPKDEYVRETRPEKDVVEQDAMGAETAEEEIVSDTAQFDKTDKVVESSVINSQLTLEEKYAMHSEFVPTPTVEEAFKGKPEEESYDDKDDCEPADEGKITFRSKMLLASTENRAIYNALKNELLSYKGVKSRVVNGGDYFRRPGKQIVKIIFIGKTIRLALALNPADYDYNLYHQKDRGGMKKYADTPMFVKVQSPLGVKRAFKLISDLMQKENVKRAKKSVHDDHLYNLTYNDEE